MTQPETEKTSTASKPEPAYKNLLADEQIAFLEAELQKSEEKAQENWDKLLRSMAELENTKRRAEKDVRDAHRYALDRFIDALIPILDSLEQALLNCTEASDSQAMRNGIELTLKMFISSLEKFGVRILNPLHEPFNPNLHEAMMMQESQDAPHNAVLSVIQKGYTLHDRLIRPARVIVVKGP